MEDSDYLKQVGENIRRIRLSQNITQMALGEMCDFERSNMRRIESGKNNLTLKTLLKIARALNVDLKDFL